MIELWRARDWRDCAINAWAETRRARESRINWRLRWTSTRLTVSAGRGGMPSGPPEKDCSHNVWGPRARATADHPCAVPLSGTVTRHAGRARQPRRWATRTPVPRRHNSGRRYYSWSGTAAGAPPGARRYAAGTTHRRPGEQTWPQTRGGAAIVHVRPQPCVPPWFSFASGHRQHDPTTILPSAIHRRIRRTRSNFLHAARQSHRRREERACRMFFDALGDYIICEVVSGLKDVPIKSRNYSVS